MHMTINAEKIKSLRKKANWSQEELATATGLSIRTVQRAETDGNAALETRRALAAAFDVQPEALDFNKDDLLPGEARIGAGYLITWVGIAWFLNLGLSVGLIGVGLIYLIGQAFRVLVFKMPVLWVNIAQGVLFTLAGIAPLFGREINLGAVLLIGFGCILIFSQVKKGG